MSRKGFLVLDSGWGSFRQTIRTDLRKTALHAADAIDTATPSPPPTPPPDGWNFRDKYKLARVVRNAILLAGYETETADIKATTTDSDVPFLHCNEFKINISYLALR